MKSPTPENSLNVVEYQSEFGRWSVTFCPPPLDLDPIAEDFWETYGTVSYGYEKIVPSGTVDLMVNLGLPQQLLHDIERGVTETFNGGWLCGIQTSPLYTAPAPRGRPFPTHFVGVSLSPACVRPLFGVDAFETSDRVVELEDLIGTDARILYEQIERCGTTAGRFSCLAAFLRRLRATSTLSVSKIATHAMNLTSVANGNIRIDEICDELRISRKHLNELYKSTVGVSPKTFARLARFRSVMDHVYCASDSWVKIATDSGFIDQSHLILDFKKFAGESPISFLKHRAPDGESVNYGDCPERLQTR